MVKQQIYWTPRPGDVVLTQPNQVISRARRPPPPLLLEHLDILQKPENPCSEPKLRRWHLFLSEYSAGYDIKILDNLKSHLRRVYFHSTRPWPVSMADWTPLPHDILTTVLHFNCTPCRDASNACRFLAPIASLYGNSCERTRREICRHCYHFNEGVFVEPAPGWRVVSPEIVKLVIIR